MVRLAALRDDILTQAAASRYQDQAALDSRSVGSYWMSQVLRNTYLIQVAVYVCISGSLREAVARLGRQRARYGAFCSSGSRLLHLPTSLNQAYTRPRTLESLSTQEHVPTIAPSHAWLSADVLMVCVRATCLTRASTPRHYFALSIPRSHPSLAAHAEAASERLSALTADLSARHTALAADMSTRLDELAGRLAATASTSAANLEARDRALCDGIDAAKATWMERPACGARGGEANLTS